VRLGRPAHARDPVQTGAYRRPGTQAEKDTYAVLACEDVNFVAEPSVATAAAMEPPAPTPRRRPPGRRAC
jgi:hypothetical protein